MTKAESFFTSAEEKKIISAIKKAEKSTSGEIRVHIDEGIGGDVLARAQKAFFALNMDQTKDKNGVLFYLSVTDNEFAICGDSGIDNFTPDDFWDDIRTIVIDHFQKQQFVQGLVKGIAKAGKSLSEYFPLLDANNELPDDISYSK